MRPSETREYQRAWFLKKQKDPVWHARKLRLQREYRRTARGRAVTEKYNKKSETKLHIRWHRYRTRARLRSIKFDLSFEQFSFFWQKPCQYCAAPILTIGLDRVDNAHGYVLGNVVACCAVCNYMKRELSVEVFVAHCRRVVDLSDKRAV